MCDVAIFALNIGIKEGTLLFGVAIFKSFVPAQPLKLQVEVKDEEWVSEVDVSEATVVPGPQIHRQVKIVEGVVVRLLDHLE